MKLIGAEQQQKQHLYYNADGAIVAGNTAQLVLARSISRSSLFFQNVSAVDMWLEIGFGTATATLTSGKVTSVAVVNGGFGYTKPPKIIFAGGGYPTAGAGSVQPGVNTSYHGLAQPNGPAPSDPAYGVAALTTGAISAITLIESPLGSGTVGGANYAIAPYVQVIGNYLDPYGCALPAVGVGIWLPSGAFWSSNPTACPTDPVAVFCGTTSSKYTCRWTD